MALPVTQSGDLASLCLEVKKEARLVAWKLLYVGDWQLGEERANSYPKADLSHSPNNQKVGAFIDGGRGLYSETYSQLCQ